MTLCNLYLAVTNYLTLGKLLGLSSRVALPVNVVCVIYTHFAGYFETNCEDICGLQRQNIFPREETLQFTFKRSHLNLSLLPMV